METSAQKYVDGNFVTLHHLLYKCIIVRGAATLTCFICISPNFPVQLPLWAITLNWNGIFNSYNNSTIRVNTINLIEFYLKKILKLISIYFKYRKWNIG